MKLSSHNVAVASVIVVAAFLASCNSVEERPPSMPPNYQPQTTQPPPVKTYSGPVLQQDGTCTSQNPGTASAIDIGIGECDLVRIKGRSPTDVLIGESGRGGRETQVLYAEPTGRELYFFVNNKLDRIVK